MTDDPDLTSLPAGQGILHQDTGNLGLAAGQGNPQPVQHRVPGKVQRAFSDRGFVRIRYPGRQVTCGIHRPRRFTVFSVRLRHAEHMLSDKAQHKVG